jgi:hypothetical protein
MVITMDMSKHDSDLEALHREVMAEIVRLQRADGDNSTEIRTLAKVCLRIREMQRGAR